MLFLHQIFFERTGTVSFKPETYGVYTGTISFSFGVRPHTHEYIEINCEVCDEIQAGLYDENDNLIRSWEDSGIDATCSNVSQIIGVFPEVKKR